MAQVKFISGDGVEHEVEETSMAAEIMRKNGFQQIGVTEESATEGTEPGSNVSAVVEEPEPEDETPARTAKGKKDATK